VAGQLELELGSIAMDSTLQRQGLLDMIASGKSNPADIGKFQFYLGNFAREAGDYPAAITALQAAIAAGYTDNQIDVLLADSYLKNKQVDLGLPALQHAIEVQKASGQPVPVSWYRSGVVAAYNARMVAPTLYFGAGLIQEEPTKQNWSLLIEVVQRVAQYPAADELDLLRLMGRTHSYAEKEDFLEYIQDADARRLPGEVLDVIAAGVASGMISANDPSIAEAKTIASARVTADRASLPSLERDARAPTASAATTKAAGDAALSYGQSADAVAMYQIALTKPGAETETILTRLGIAQIDTGDFTGAQATFAKVTGPRQPLAQLWSIYAAEKAAGK
jgi:tetratricopeptide (TPR) repeat protein